MKKLIIGLAAIFASVFALSANDNILSKISAANAKVSTLQASFERARLIGASGRNIVSPGKLYFTSDGKLSMIYDNGEVLVIDGAEMRMTKGGKTTKFDTAKNPLMKGLSSMLINSIAGKPSVAANDNGAEISASEEGDSYVVTLTTANKKGKRGYSEVTLHYRKSDCVLVEMCMVEFTNITTTYTIKSVKTNATVDGSVFGK